jgi:oligopeptide transport system ATP-binding protein
MGEAERATALAGVDLVKRYAARGGLTRRDRAGALAVAGVSLAVGPGEIYGLVGRSGAGKSTLGRILALLEKPDAGEVRYQGERVDDRSGRQLRAVRRGVQIVFQDPGTSLNPLQRVRRIVQEPLDVHRLGEPGARRGRVRELLAAVGLPENDAFAARYPRELSGGERQRVAIARALACDPRALVLDEPVSALDVSIRGQVLNLLVELRDRFSLAMLLIAHDLALVGSLCDRVGVMLAGRIVEEGSVASVLDRPLHPYARSLVRASLGQEAPDGEADGDTSSQESLASPGCGYAPRCGRAMVDCGREPTLLPAGPEHLVACHHPEER